MTLSSIRRDVLALHGSTRPAAARAFTHAPPLRRPASPSWGRRRAGGARGTMAGLVGWVLRHRRLLVTAYAVALHCLVYYLLLYSGSCPQARPRH